MSGIQDCQNVRLYIVICPRCGKIFVSLHKFQVIQNTIQHLKRHKIDVEPGMLTLHVKDINICKEDD